MTKSTAKNTKAKTRTIKSRVAKTPEVVAEKARGFADFMNEDTVLTTPSIESRELRIGATTKKVAGCAALVGVGILIGTKLS